MQEISEGVCYNVLQNEGDVMKERNLSLIKDLSILIVTWKGDKLLVDCLNTIMRVYGDIPEIVVVDNANLISTKEVVSRFKNVRYVASTSNLGFAGGNNLGFPLCTRKYVLLLNNDTILYEDSFCPMIRFLEDHPHVAVVQGKMRLSKLGDVLDTCGYMLTPGGVLHDHYIMKNALATEVTSHRVYSAKGAMMLLRRDIVDRLGGVLFYEHFHSNYEEVDFCHRVWLQGFEVYCLNTPLIDHLQGQTISRLNQVEVSGKTLGNQLFSIFTTFEFCNMIKIGVWVILLNFIVSLSRAFKGEFCNIRSFVYAIRSVWQRRVELMSSRKRIQGTRKISDLELLSKIMVHPPIRYYYYAFRGNALKCQSLI